MPKQQYRRENLYKIIAIYTGPDGKTAGAKFRNIQVDKPSAWKNTEAFLKRKFPSITSVNVYGGISGNFIRQISFNQ